MRILFCFAWALDGLGGAEASVLTLAEALVHRGHGVGIVETEGAASERPRIHPFGGPVWVVPVASPGRHPRSWPAVFDRLRRFRGILSQFKPDIVSVQCPVWQSVPVTIAASLPRTWRLVVTARGSDVRGGLVREPRLKPWLRRLCRQADAATAVGDSLWRDFIREFPAVQRKGRVIHNGVGDAWFEGAWEPDGASGEPYALFVGRLHPDKGVDLLVRAWNLLPPATQPDLWFAGAGEAEDDLRALAHRLGIAPRLRFLGRVSQADLPALYRRARIVVIPSRTEGLPRVALEAGACGAVCVATRVGGIPEVVEDGVTGLLTEPESPQALADALVRGLRLSPDEQRRMSAAARSRIRRHFHHDRTVAEYEALFRSLLRPGFAAPTPRRPWVGA